MSPQQHLAAGRHQYGMYAVYRSADDSEPAKARVAAFIPANAQDVSWFDIPPGERGPMWEDCVGMHAAKWYA